MTTINRLAFYQLEVDLKKKYIRHSVHKWANLATVVTVVRVSAGITM